MKKYLSLVLLGLSVICSAESLKVHMLSGSEEYKSEASLTQWAEHLQKNYDIKTTFSLGTDKCTSVDNLQALEETDVLVVFCRRWKLSDDQAEQVVDYIESGKPILGIRTASHAFEFYKPFDKEVLGGDYSGHDKGETPVKVQVASPTLPILAGVSGWERIGKPYRNPSVTDDVVLLLEADINHATYPLAWIRTSNDRKVFYTSLGIPADFETDSFIRLLDNSLFWLAE